MDPIELWYEGAHGARLYCRSWPAAESRATLIALHGLGDHSGLYPMIGERLAARGIAVLTPDLRGNGRSPGQRGYVDAWADLREDLGRLVERSRAEAPGRPLFLLGMSLGGLVVLDYALQHPEGLRGVIALSPPLGELGVPAPLLALGRVLSRVWPRFSLETGMDLTGLSRDTAVVVRQGGEDIVLDRPYAAVRQTLFGPRPYVSNPEEVAAEFGAALAAQPGRPAAFTLYFVEGGDEFTDESKEILDRVLAEIAKHPVPDIVIVGHTDLVGGDTYNDALAQRRAETARAMLAARGIASDGIVAIGRGKREPLVPTADGVAEPRNRRVEIIVR